MKVELDFENHKCLVMKESGDPVFRNGGFAGKCGAEERFLYHVKQALRKKGYDVIKKKMAKDGHMVDDLQSYVRTRNWGKEGKTQDGEFAIWWDMWAIHDAASVFNKNGFVCLHLETCLYWKAD